ncbi:DUF4386 domain-containing protein [Flavobacterium yafengii]|uniref:DUF4386 domain-containing protein n=1 Tax=Flavobacterium yafengii TaxID=3041253 RepID=A0AAW6TQH5_9FLAO|nr:DUF4386 domain-containing protein [Flavobacterium yafengii]MDI5950373.1 DUF4386 domain-containing protein [Flavobacterium yafengii]
MNSIRKNAIIVGVLFILAAVSAIIGLALYQPILNDPDFIIKGAANNTQVIWGAFFELILAFSVIGISYMMYPILKKKNENMAIGYVCFRLLEGSIVVIGIISLLSLVTLNQDFSKVSNQNVSSFLIAGKLLVAVHNWTFLFGPNFALGPSTLMMSYFLYKSKLVPRYISIFGLVGGPLIFTCAVLVMFGVFLQVSVWGAILAIPVFAYEMSLAIWLIAKGFNSTQLANS